MPPEDQSKINNGVDSMSVSINKVIKYNKILFRISTILLGSAIFIGGGAGIVRFFLCYSDAHGFKESFFCNLISPVAGLAKFYPISLIFVFVSLSIFLFVFLLQKTGLKRAIIILCVIVFLIFMAAPGNLGYLLFRAVTLDL